MAVNPEDLTIDYKKLQAVPFRDRKALLYSGFSDQINAALTPSQRANLFPNYYRQEAAAATEAATTGVTNLSKADYLNQARNKAGVSYSDANKANGNAVSKAPPKPELTPGRFRAVEGTMLAGSVDIAKRKEEQNLTLTSGVRTGSFADTLQSGEVYPSVKKAGKAFQSYNKGKAFGYRGGTMDFSQMSLSEIMRRQNLPMSHPDKLFAVGAYQVIPETMKEAVNALGLDPDKVTGDEATQTKIMTWLTSEKPGRQNIGKFIKGDSDNLSLAQEQMAQEWASMASISKGGRSYYDDGVNKAKISLEQTKAALEDARERYRKNIAAGMSPEIAYQSALTGMTPEEKKQETATEVAGTKKTMVISMGTNDWDNPKDTYQNTLEAIKAAQAKGYEVVVVPPKDGDPKFQAAHDEVMKAVGETGVKTEVVQDWSGTGGYHPSNDEAKRIAEKYPGQTFVGDSIAKQMGSFSKDSTKIATDGLGTGKILENMQSDQVATLATKPETPQDALAIAQGVAAQIQTPTATEVEGGSTFAGSDLLGFAPGEENVYLGGVSKIGAIPTSGGKGVGSREFGKVYIDPETGKGYNIRSGRGHAGTDFGADAGFVRGTPFKAHMGGEILGTGNDPEGYGKYIDVKYDDGSIHRFAHNEENVATGRFEKGSELFKVGVSGNADGWAHAHAEVWLPKEIDGKQYTADQLYQMSQGMASKTDAGLAYRSNPRTDYWEKYEQQQLARREKFLSLQSRVKDNPEVISEISSEELKLLAERGQELYPDLASVAQKRIADAKTETSVSAISSETVVPSEAPPAQTVATVTEAPKANTVPTKTMAQGGVINPIGDSEIVTRSPTTGEITQRTKVAEYGAEQIKIQPMSKMNAEALTPKAEEMNREEAQAPQTNEEKPVQKASMATSKLPSKPYTSIDSDIKRPNSTALRAALQIRMNNTARGDYI